MDMWTATVNADLAFQEFVRERRESARAYRFGRVSPALVMLGAIASSVERAAGSVRAWAGKPIEAAGPDALRVR